MLYSKVKGYLDALLGCDVVLERPKNRDFGHFATPVAFTLAKVERKNPKLLSEEIAEKLQKCELFAKVETLNGYINLTLSPKVIFESLEIVLFQRFQTQMIGKERILLEYVSANPTGPLHIGHARGAVFGDALYKMAKFLGYEIVSEYYINDAGSQIQMLGLSIYLAGREILGYEVSYPEVYYRGEYINEVAQKAREEFGDRIFDSEDGISKLADFGKDLMLEEIKHNLASIGIIFDTFVSEKAMYQRWDNVLKTLQNHQGIYSQDHKLWLKSTQYGDEKDRVVVRENGEPTYLAGDIIYHQDKFQRGYDRYMNIWGADHHGYIARVKASIEYLGFDSSKLEVLLSQMVKLLKNGQPYKMSKRAGNFILMQDVVEDIGSDALRFIFLSKKADTSLEFDVDELKKQDSSNPVFYINYANSRIYSLIEKSQYTLEEIKDAKVSTLESSLEELLFVSLQLPYVIQNAFVERSPLKLCDYLKNLASLLHGFYTSNKILGHSYEREILKVLLCVSVAIEQGLDILGIKAKRAM